MTFRSALKHASELSGGQLSKILDTLSSAFHNELESTQRDGQDLDNVMAYRNHKEALEYYAYLLLWFVLATEKRLLDASTKPDGKADDKHPDEEDTQPSGKKKKAPPKRAKGAKAKSKEITDFDWPAAIPQVLALLAKALRVKTERIWQETAERDAFVRCVLRICSAESMPKRYCRCTAAL